MELQYEKLRVTKEIRIFIRNVYVITKHFPKDEVFSLTSQIRRASISVLLNLAEGHARRGRKEFVHFLKISIGSLLEVDAAMKIAFDLGYMSEEEVKNIASHIQCVYFPLLKLRDSIEKL